MDGDDATIAVGGISLGPAVRVEAEIGLICSSGSSTARRGSSSAINRTRLAATTTASRRASWSMCTLRSRTPCLGGSGELPRHGLRRGWYCRNMARSTTPAALVWTACNAKADRRLPQLDRNGRIVVAARTLRSFAFGLNAVALGLFLSAIGLSGAQFGLVLSAALAGSLGLTVVIAGWGDRIGRRRLLMAGSALMVTAAIIPLVSREPLMLAVIALSGMVAVNANESIGLQSRRPGTDPAERPARAAHRCVRAVQRAGGRGRGAWCAVGRTAARLGAASA